MPDRENLAMNAARRLSSRTQEELKEEDLVADESVLITITQRGYIKRVAASLYRTQNRGRPGSFRADHAG